MAALLAAGVLGSLSVVAPGVATAALAGAIGLGIAALAQSKNHYTKVHYGRGYKNTNHFPYGKLRYPVKYFGQKYQKPRPFFRKYRKPKYTSYHPNFHPLYRHPHYNQGYYHNSPPMYNNIYRSDNNDNPYDKSEIFEPEHNENSENYHNLNGKTRLKRSLREENRLTRLMDVIRLEDRSECGLRLVCELAGFNERTLTKEGAAILSLIGPSISPGNGLHPTSGLEEYRIAKGFGEMGFRCFDYYHTCPLNGTQLLEAITQFLP